MVILGVHNDLAITRREYLSERNNFLVLDILAHVLGNAGPNADDFNKLENVVNDASNHSKEDFVLAPICIGDPRMD